MTTHNPNPINCGSELRGGGGARATNRKTAAIAVAMSARPAVTNIGSSSSTAMRVIGNVIPKITTPTKPSARPRRRLWGSKVWYFAN